MFDVYKNKRDPAERMATAPGAGLPDHVTARELELMPAGASQIIEDVEEDIAARGFCHFKLL